MTRSGIAAALTLSVIAATPYSLGADVKTDQKTHVEMAGVLGTMVNMFGGKAAREGVVSTTVIKGDRKATIGEQTSQIIDLHEEKVYDLDMKKKTYRVTTFVELRQKREEARRKAEEAAQKRQARDKNQQADKDQKEPEIDFNIKQTGQKKAINGFDASEEIMTITIREKGKTIEQGGGMVLTSDMWITGAIPALKEIMDFQLRYMRKLEGPEVSGASAQDMAAAMAMYPQMKDALARMNAEAVKLPGTPIETTTTMDIVPSADQAAQQQKQGGDDDSKAGAPAGLGGLLGGFAKRGQKKADTPDKPEEGQAKGGRTTFMTMTSEVLKVATEVSAADLAIPAGFKENR